MQTLATVATCIFVVVGLLQLLGTAMRLIGHALQSPVARMLRPMNPSAVLRSLLIGSGLIAVGVALHKVVQ